MNVQEYLVMGLIYNSLITSYVKCLCHVLLCYSYIFFGEVFVQPFCSCFTINLFVSFNINYIFSHILCILVTTSLSDTCRYKYFLPFCGLPFNILTFILKSEHFKFDKIYQFLMGCAFGALCPNLTKISSVPFILRFITYLS